MKIFYKNVCNVWVICVEVCEQRKINEKLTKLKELLFVFTRKLMWK